MPCVPVYIFALGSELVWKLCSQVTTVVLKQSLPILWWIFFIRFQKRSDSRLQLLTGDSNAPKEVLFESRMQKFTVQSFLDVEVVEFQFAFVACKIWRLWFWMGALVLLALPTLVGMWFYCGCFQLLACVFGSWIGLGVASSSWQLWILKDVIISFRIRVEIKEL
jgi:hypothetical protein